MAIQKKLRGLLELSVFMKQGLDKFDNTRSDFLWSLLIPLVFIPLQIPIAMYDDELSQYPLKIMAVILAWRVIVGTAFFLGGVWLVSWPLECKDKFYRFATAMNWMDIVSWSLLLPFPIFIGLFDASSEGMGNYLLLSLSYIAALVAFVARHALKVHWVVAGLIALGGFAVQIVAAEMI